MGKIVISVLAALLAQGCAVALPAAAAGGSYAAAQTIAAHLPDSIEQKGDKHGK